MIENLELTLDYLVRRTTFCGWSIPTRTIANYELVFVTAGEGIIVIEGKKHKARAGDLFYFTPNKKHSLCVTQEPCMVFYGVHFTMQNAADGLPLPDVEHLENLYKVELLFKQLEVLYTQKPYLYQWQQNIMLQHILCEICIALHRPEIPTNLARVKRVLEYIHATPCRAFTLAELESEAHVKKSLFLQSFRQITGTSPLQYAMQLRLTYARDLLLNTNFSVGEVARQCGFQDAFYFSRCFKKTFKLSPANYRAAQA